MHACAGENKKMGTGSSIIQKYMQNPAERGAETFKRAAFSQRDFRFTTSCLSSYKSVNQQAQEQKVKCEKGSGEQQTGSHQYLCLSEPQVASACQDRPMYGVTHRPGGRFCCVSHTPQGSSSLGTLYFRDHWEAF